jgi:hypothetical protein
MINRPAPQLQPSWKRLLQTPTKTKRISTALTLLITLVMQLATHAAPYGNNIPLPEDAVTYYKSPAIQYEARYDSWFGGHWEVKGRRQFNKDGTFTDTIAGTCSAPDGTYTQVNFTWLSDSWYAAGRSPDNAYIHTWIPARSFTLTVSRGSVKGTATFRP